MLTASDALKRNSFQLFTYGNPGWCCRPFSPSPPPPTSLLVRSEWSSAKPHCRAAPVKIPYAPDCRRCGMPGMFSAGRRIAYDSPLSLNQLVYLCERLFTRLSTFDIDRSTRTVMGESLDCVAPYVVDFVDDTFQPWPEIPLPDT